MKKTLFITSALAVLAAAPAMAADSEPYMNNTEHAASCVESVLGVTSGAVVATPGYTIRSYNCAAGNYFVGGDSWTNANNLDGATETCATCPSGSFCAGVINHDYTTTDYGETSCSTATSGVYTLSDAGQSSVNACYRTCAVDSDDPTASDIPHAATYTSGSRFYSNQTAGDGNNGCVAETCVAGYTVQNGVCVANGITITWKDAANNNIDVTGTDAAGCTYDGTVYTPAAEPVKKGYTFTGWTLDAAPQGN